MPSNLFMWSSGNVKSRRKETQSNMGDAWNELNEIILHPNTAAGEPSTTDSSTWPSSLKAFQKTPPQKPEI